MRDFAISPIPSWAQRLWAEAGLAVALGGVLAILGPFKTYEGEFLARVGYWVALSAIWFVVAGVVGLALDRSQHAQRLTDTARFLLKVVLTALPMVLIVAPANKALLDSCPGNACQLVRLYPKVLLVGFGLTLISTALFSGAMARHDRDKSDADDADGAATPLTFQAVEQTQPVVDVPRPQPLTRAGPDCPLLAKLPADIHGAILCLETEDHYVRVYTARGSALILMRMTDAIEALGAMPGLRVHRSWWVAGDAVRSVSRSGRTLQLELENGLTVPVSQPYMKAVRESFGALVD